MSLSVEKIRARRAARMRNRLATSDGSVQFGTLLDDEIAFLLGEVDHLEQAKDDLNDQIADCRVLEYKERMEKAEAELEKNRNE